MSESVKTSAWRSKKQKIGFRRLTVSYSLPSMHVKEHTQSAYNCAFCCTCVCENWPVTIREEDTLTVLKNRGWRKLRNEELHALYTTPNIIKVITLRMRGQDMQHVW